LSCLKDSSIHPIDYRLIDAKKLGEKIGYKSTLIQESIRCPLSQEQNSERVFQRKKKREAHHSKITFRRNPHSAPSFSTQRSHRYFLFAENSSPICHHTQESSDDSELDEELAPSNAFDPFSQPYSGRGLRIKIQYKPSISRDLVDQRYKKNK